MNKDNRYTVYVTSEECSEVSQELMKLVRFGINQTHPDTGKSNKESLELEIGQLKYCLDRLSREQGLDPKKIQESYDNKLLTWNKWKVYYDAL